jgi:UDP-N-acetyl-D-mannosaminuronic acid transferase (WecB/TagA/CpsF family)
VEAADELMGFMTRTLRARRTLVVEPVMLSETDNKFETVAARRALIFVYGHCTLLLLSVTNTRSQSEVGGEPVAREVCNRLERTGLLEEVGCVGNDRESILTSQLLLRRAIERQDNRVVSADDEEGGGPHRGELRPG